MNRQLSINERRHLIVIGMVPLTGQRRQVGVTTNAASSIHHV